MLAFRSSVCWMDGLKFNLQKGLFRLWIVLSIAWFAFWSYSVFSVNETGISIKGSVHLHDIVLAMTLPFWLFLLPLWVIVKLSKFVQSKNLIRKLRSMATIPKWILFLGIVGSIWFLGKKFGFGKQLITALINLSFFLNLRNGMLLGIGFSSPLSLSHSYPIGYSLV